jgi:hypothetical protein
MTGGPIMWMNMIDDMWGTVSSDRVGVQMSFITLNPRSQAAVLTGIVSTANNNFWNSDFTVLPLLSLNSRKASFTSVNGSLNL